MLCRLSPKSSSSSFVKHEKENKKINHNLLFVNSFYTHCARFTTERYQKETKNNNQEDEEDEGRFMIYCFIFFQNSINKQKFVSKERDEINPSKYWSYSCSCTLGVHYSIQ